MCVLWQKSKDNGYLGDSILMKTLLFITKKIIIVEIMLIIIYFAKSCFNINISIINLIVDTFLKYLTPIAIMAIIPYFILSILSNKIIEVALGVALGGFILYFIFKYYLIL